MTMPSQRGGFARKVVALAILAITAYVVTRLLLYLFPVELHRTWNWIQAKL